MNIYDKTITILNKLRGEDNPVTPETEGARTTYLDAWKITTISDCGWYVTSIADMNGSNVVMGNTIKVMIPFNKGYLKYNDWKTSQTGFTVSKDDYIILGTISEETIGPNDIVRIIKKYSPNVCTVRSFRELDKRVGNTLELFIEGV